MRSFVPTMIGLVLHSSTSFGVPTRYDCFPQYNLNSCTPKVSLAASIYLSSPPSVFIEKYMPGATVGVFSADCVGSFEAGLECTDPTHGSRFVARKVGNNIAATFDGDPASPQLFNCRR